MTEMLLPRLIDTVQTNCNISDARYAREMTMCNYLLGMRELYRWEHELPLSMVLSKEDVSTWLTQRETGWDEIEHRDFLPLSIAGRYYDPFDLDPINQALLPFNLVYGSGYGRWGQPDFFLAQLLRREQRSGLPVLISGCEYARGMTAPPAVLNQGTIFLRTDAMQRWLWGKFEIWGVHKADNALQAALDCYDDLGAEKKLARMAEREGEILILHEIGEARAESILGEVWRDMLASFASRRAELLMRAVRDNLADCLVTLPELSRRNEAASIHFYFSNFEGMRRKLFPRLVEAYQQWQVHNDGAILASTADAGCAHWQGEAERMLEAWGSQVSGNAETVIENWAEYSATLVL